MAATLVLGSKRLVVDALKEDLTHAFLAKVGGTLHLTKQMTSGEIAAASSDGSTRIKQLRINGVTTEYRTENSLGQNDESRITNFYIENGIAVNRLALMNSSNSIGAIITFPTITPNETKSLYIPQIRISVL